MRNALIALVHLTVMWLVCALCLWAVVALGRALHEPTWVQMAACAALILRWMLNPALRHFLDSPSTPRPLSRGSHD